VHTASPVHQNAIEPSRRSTLLRLNFTTDDVHKRNDQPSSKWSCWTFNEYLEEWVKHSRLFWCAQLILMSISSSVERVVLTSSCAAILDTSTEQVTVSGPVGTMPQLRSAT
jgi:hypothetical protein